MIGMELLWSSCDYYT